MELLKTTKNRAVEVVATPDDPRCIAIAERFGGTEGFMGKWNPWNLPDIIRRMDLCEEQGVPSLVMMMRTYGEKAVVKNLAILLSAAIFEMGEMQLDYNDAQIVATNIVQNEDVRTLNYALVVNFFAELKQGKWEIYAGKTGQITRAFNRYLQVARERQRKLRDAHEARLRKEQEDAAARDAVNWAEFASSKNIKAASPLEYLTQLLTQQR